MPRGSNANAGGAARGRGGLGQLRHGELEGKIVVDFAELMEPVRFDKGLERGKQTVVAEQLRAADGGVAQAWPRHVHGLADLLGADPLLDKVDDGHEAPVGIDQQPEQGLLALSLRNEGVEHGERLQQLAIEHGVGEGEDGEFAFAGADLVDVVNRGVAAEGQGRTGRCCGRSSGGTGGGTPGPGTAVELVVPAVGLADWPRRRS